MRPAWVVLLLVGLPGLSGCIECEPERVAATVALEAVGLRLRSLPVLASGGTEVAGVEVPDSHARLEFEVAVGGGPRVVEVHDLRLAVRVDGDPVPGEVTLVESSGGAWHERGGGWDGTVRDGGRLVLWWGVDWNEAGVDAVVLEEGAPAAVDASFSWSVDDCTHRADGEVHHAEALPVSAALVTTTFEAVGGPTLDPGTLGSSFRVDLRVTNGVTTEVRDGRAVAVLLPTGTGAPGAAAWPGVETYVGPLPGDTVAPGETLTVREGATTPWTGGRRGLAILVLHLDHRAADGTGGPHEDVLGFAVEL